MNPEQQKALVPAVEKEGAMQRREDFGGTQTQALAETASTAVAAQARAAVEARYVMALRKPRDWDDVRVRLLKECNRPGFARVARYNKPIGKGVQGPSIRFAESALRCMGNVLPEQMTVYDDDTKRILRVTVTDLEANITFSKDVTIDKTVERQQVKEGQEVLGRRLNSYGKTVYLVRATEDDLLNKAEALASKALRGLALRILPGDILDECMWKVQQVAADEDAKDPGAARRAIVDAFALVGVRAADLKTYLGKELDALLPPELANLRAILATIKDGEATWKDYAEKAEGEGAASADKTQAQRLKDALGQKTGKPAPTAAETPNK